MKKIITATVGAALISVALLSAGAANADVYYKNCSEALVDEMTPLFEGDPSYAPHLDRDNDSIACE